MALKQGEEPGRGPRHSRDLADWHHLMTPVGDYAGEAALRHLGRAR